MDIGTEDLKAWLAEFQEAAELICRIPETIQLHELEPDLNNTSAFPSEGIRTALSTLAFSAQQQLTETIRGATETIRGAVPHYAGLGPEQLYADAQAKGYPDAASFLYAS